MEYSIDQVDKAIYYYLSTNPNVSVSINKLYDELIKEDICPDLKNPNKRDLHKTIFTTRCHTLHNNYNCVKQSYKRNVLYLMFTKSDEDIKFPISYTDNLENITFSSPIELLENIFNYKMQDTIQLCDYYNETDTLLHSVCREGNLKLLEDIKKQFSIDIDLKNKFGETLIDVIPPTPDGLKIQKLLLEDKYEKILLDKNYENLNLKKTNTRYINEINKLKQQVNSNGYMYALVYTIVPILVFYFLKSLF